MLSNWLTAISEKDISPFFTSTFSCQGNFPEIKNAKVVVFSRGDEFSSVVRSSLSKLHNHSNLQIVDIGNLNIENNSSAYQVISELQDGHILPILIGVDINAFQDFCKAMLLENKLHNCAYISNSALSNNEKYNIDNIGFQRHFLPKFKYDEIMDSQTPGLSLGTLRSNQKILEPILRESNYLHFDLAGIRSSECRNKTNSLPTGLYSEEACQIMKYAGEGLKLKLITIDTEGLSDHNNEAGLLVAEMIWYFLEGKNISSNDHPGISDDFSEFIIELNEVDHSLIFTQSNKSGKWWLKIDNNANKYISCAYEEYQQTVQNEIPDRLLKLM